MHPTLHNASLEQSMKFNDSPLDYLAAFAIAFASGALSAVGMFQYITTLKSKWPTHEKRMPPL